MHPNRTKNRAILQAIVVFIADLAFFSLLLLCTVPVFVAAFCAGVLSICAGFLVYCAQQKTIPCELDSFLTKLIYCGLSGIPSLLVDGLIVGIGNYYLPEWKIGWKAIAAGVAIFVFFLCSPILQKPLQKLQKIINGETVSYLFFGALTTLVNILIHWLLSERLMVLPMLSNTVAWVGSVLFAYVTNRKYVFKSHTVGAEFRKEVVLFLLARLLSLGVDAGGMALCLYVFQLDNMLSKVLLNVVVIILNYFASKWMIFGKKQEE